MSKSIVFCADGTWNGPPPATASGAEHHADGDEGVGELSDVAVTNVLKLFSNLDGQGTAETIRLQNEQEKELRDDSGAVVQVAKYLHGVGDSHNPIIKVLGGTVGLGVIGRVIRGYTFLSRRYVPGDQIHICGFSRGAYTARTLAGLVCRVGLLDPAKCDLEDKDNAYRLGIKAWGKAKGVQISGSGKVVDFANRLIDLGEGLLGSGLPADHLIADVPIKSVAVWDTVGSMGIPVYKSGQRFDVFRFTDESLNPLVENGFHAMAIDELRRDFPVSKWKARQGIAQVWFVGAHADVGGGYAADESRLSDISLEWMMHKLQGVGVRFVSPFVYAPSPAVAGAAIHEPWAKVPFDHLQKAPRVIEMSDILHPTVFERFEDPRYRPQALSDVAPNGLADFARDVEFVN